MAKSTEYYRYLPTGPREEQWGLYLTGAGIAEIAPGAASYPARTHVHPASHEYTWQKGRTFHEYAIVYIFAGCGEFESEATGGTELDDGTAIFLFPEVWHRYRPHKETGWSEYWATFQGDYAKRLQKNGFLSPQSPLHRIGYDENIVGHFKAILERLRFETIGFQQEIAAELLAIIAATLSAAKRRGQGGGSFELIRRAKTAIEEQTEGTLVVEKLASALGLSAGHFRQVFKQHTGLSPYQYHQQLKISRAKSLLRSSDATIKQIAKILGFESVFSFSKLFKKKTSVSPHQWLEAQMAPGMLENCREETLRQNKRRQSANNRNP
jgi:AraC-like DNA-binding protein